MPSPLKVVDADRSFIEQTILAEARRGEWAVAWARVILFTFFLIVFSVGPPELPTAEATATVRRLVLAIMGGSSVFAWAWLWLLWKRPFRPFMGAISVLVDALVGVLSSVVPLLWGTHSGALAVAIGAAPPIFAAWFVVASSALRLSPWACVVAGVASAALYGIAVPIARAWAPLHELRPEVAGLSSGFAWFFGRGVFFFFGVAVLAIAARNARRLAMETGTRSAQQARLVSLFGRYVAPDVANELLTRGEAGAEMREVTVMFTDLRDFTALSERLSPPEVLRTLNAHYELIVPIAQRHGGTVNKFVGDAVMVIFGAPVSHEDHATRAVQAAVEMIQAMNHRMPEVQMGVGLCSGPVVVGSLGSADRLEYAVIGDTVNTASRLEGLNKQLGTQVLVSESTWRAVGERIALAPMGEHPVKGKALPVPVFTPVLEARRPSTGSG